MNGEGLKNYKKRIIEETIKKYLNVAGAICVEGPKWCGKTSTSFAMSKSHFYVGAFDYNFSNKEIAKLNPKIMLEGENPRLIDEWQEEPWIWDAVRWEVDWRSQKGQFILTGSSTPKHKGILHSGAGRIVKVRMETMSLFESEDSTGAISLSDLCNGKINEQLVEPLSFEKLAYLIVRGGWPKNIDASYEDCHLLPNSYIKTVLDESIKEIDNVKYDPLKVKLILKSLARNESTLVSEETIIKDITENDKRIISRPTLNKYIDLLNRMFIFNNQQPYSPDTRSSLRVRISEKKRFCDPSLACALLNVNHKKLMNEKPGQNY
ncbi:ATP-binding protein [Mycoplasma mycoides]|uniref:ATP-binding protein n=1 Tax=Mycoplasma mycoides TaxID=2102 RepID=UPI00223F1736|nr:AAA family ATPase [Mycoplasma mycoides]